MHPRTSGHMDFETEKINSTIRKNMAISYGLTIVVGIPFPTEITNRINNIQSELESLLPGRFTWQKEEQLHATLFAPLRSRYREQPPLLRKELPDNLEDFTQELGNLFAAICPYIIEWQGIEITEDGCAIVCENTAERRLFTSLRRFQGIDIHKVPRGSKITIGYLNTSKPFLSREEKRDFAQGFDLLANAPVGQMQVRQMWLVHYANRTLNRIIGRVPYTLGATNLITASDLLQKLQIEVCPTQT